MIFQKYWCNWYNFKTMKKVPCKVLTPIKTILSVFMLKIRRYWIILSVVHSLLIALNVAKETGFVIQLAPSTIKVLDVMKDDAPLARKSEASAISWRVPSLCKGIFWTYFGGICLPPAKVKTVSIREYYYFWRLWVFEVGSIGDVLRCKMTERRICVKFKPPTQTRNLFDIQHLKHSNGSQNWMEYAWGVFAIVFAPWPLYN